MVRLLLEKGAKPNALDNEGEKPVDLAREMGRADVAELLESLTREL